MSFDKRSITSALNGAKSHGPKTPEGKEASSRNSRSHGLLAEAIIFDGESAERFEALHEAIRQELKPETCIEEALVENMTVCRWRQMRLWTMESAGVCHEIRKQAEANRAENKSTQAAIAFRTLSDESKSLELMNRYETRFDRQFSRSLSRFLQLRAARTAGALDPTTAPDQTAAPEQTAVPDETIAVDQTAAPDETPAPHETPASDAAAAPDETAPPDETAAPDQTAAPHQTAGPDEPDNAPEKRYFPNEPIFGPSEHYFGG